MNGKFYLEDVGLRVIDPQSLEPKDILKDITVEIPEGQIFTIIGPSGSGKTSLLLLLNRMHDATSGRIWLDGKDLLSMDVVGLRQQVGIVLQKPYMFGGTVQDNILIGPRLKKQKPRRTPMELLHLVGLDPTFEKREARTLSGGEQQRVTLARTLANDPGVLLLDEVTASLDNNSAHLVEDLVRNLNQAEGITFVWVTHDLQQAQRVGDYSLLLMQGQLIEQGKTSSLFENPRTVEGRRYLKSQTY